jgi:hypothetical protein
MGVGTGTFVCNLGPVLMGSSPRSHLARLQALLSLAQSGAVLIFYNLLGAIAHADSATSAMVTCSFAVMTLWGCVPGRTGQECRVPPPIGTG